MDLKVHQIPPEVFSDLAAGHASADATSRLIAAQHSKHALLIRQVVESARNFGHHQAQQARDAFEQLGTIQQRNPEAVDAVLYHPPVGSWARQTIRLLRDARTSADATPGQLSALVAAAAIRSGTTCSVEVPVADSSVMLPSVGRVVLPASATREPVQIEVADGQAQVTGDGWTVEVCDLATADQPGWHGLRRLSASAAGTAIRILIEDLDPYRMPGSSNLCGRLTASESSHWRDVLIGAWELLCDHHQGVAAEVASIVRVFTPLIAPPHGHVSATSRETFGSVALSAPPDPCSLAVTLAHEVQHAKLSALLDVVPLALPDDGSRHYAPWREDPRPVAGLLQGAYAFFGVAAFWRRQRSAETGEMAIRAAADFARWRASVQLVVDTLAASGRLTAAGEIFVAGIAGTLRSWQDDRVPAEASALALRASDDHRALWLSRHGDRVAGADRLN